jgi:precorrin-6B methylase 1
MTKPRPPRRHELFILGSGMFTHRQMTAETIEALERADVVFHLTMPDVHDFLVGRCKKVIDLIDLYRNGEVNADVYARIVDTVLAAAKRHRRVAYLVLGHPRLFDRSALTLVERAPADGVTATVLPAVSAFDAMLNELDIDVGETGLQMFEANRLKIYEHALSPSVPLLLFQIGFFGTRVLTRGSVSREERIAPLVEYLLRFYPPRHRALVLECRIAERHAGLREWTELRRLPELVPRLTYNSTLYVPRVKPPKVADRAFERRLHDREHARRLLA